MMSENTHCPACGGDWSGGQTCTDHFHLMGAWELEHKLYDVHHLMVVCYYLQHPGLYSPEGLNGAKQMLIQFLEEGITPQMMRQRLSKKVNSGTRKYKIKGTPESHGTYLHPIRWTFTAGDVTSGGTDNYYKSIQTWAESILKSLRETANL